MKKKVLITIFALVSVIRVNGTILTVNNNIGNPAQYTNLQTAINAANANDTLYIAASAANYGAPTINKKLTLIGSGMRYNIQGQSATTIYNDYHITAAASGTSFLGLNFGNHGNNLCDSAVTNLAFRNCNFYNTNISIGKSASNWVIEGCVFDAASYFGSVANNSFSNFLFQNNIYAGSYALVTPQAGLTTLSNITIKNNIFYTNVTNQNAFNFSFAGWSNVVVANNIFFQTKSGYSGYGSTVTYLNNCSYLNSENISNTGDDAGNINATNPLFVNYPSTGQLYFNALYDMHLQTGSPCIGTGVNGTDIGVYGGNQRYNAAVIPPIPQIISFDLYNSTVPSNGLLQLNATVRNQN